MYHFTIIKSKGCDNIISSNLLKFTDNKMQNYATLFKIGENYKFCLHKFPTKIKGYEEKQKLKLFNFDFAEILDYEFTKEETPFDEERKKLDVNIVRARTKLLELVQCNSFEWFGTLTFNSKNVDRYDYQKCKKEIQRFFHNYTMNNQNKDFSFICIPEKHQDGAFHFHCLFKGINQNELELMTNKHFLPYKILELINSGDKVYNWKKYDLGWCYFEKIKNLDSCSLYVTKYVSKSLISTVGVGEALYLRSRRLLKPYIIAQGELINDNDIEYTFENEFISIANFKDFDCKQINFYLSKFKEMR